MRPVNPNLLIADHECIPVQIERRKRGLRVMKNPHTPMRLWGKTGVFILDGGDWRPATPADILAVLMPQEGEKDA